MPAPSSNKIDASVIRPVLSVPVFDNWSVLWVVAGFLLVPVVGPVSVLPVLSVFPGCVPGGVVPGFVPGSVVPGLVPGLVPG